MDQWRVRQLLLAEVDRLQLDSETRKYLTAVTMAPSHYFEENYHGEHDPSRNKSYVINTSPLVMDGLRLEYRDKLPCAPAIYFVVSSRTGLLYIGKADNLRNRWRSHHRLEQFEAYRDARICWIVFPNISSANLVDLEREYIDYFKPGLNYSPVPGDEIDKSGNSSKNEYIQIGISKDSDFLVYLKSKQRETGINPTDQILLYAMAHFDMIKGQSR